MKKILLYLSLILSSQIALSYWGDDNPVSEAFNFMKDSKYELYSCAVITDGTKLDFEPKQIHQFSFVTMAQNLEEAKVKTFDRLHVDVVKVKQKYLIKFRSAGSILKDIKCTKTKDLI